MCRIAAYIGPSTPLSSLLYEPPHSLEVQAYKPRELVSGTVNVDGTGVAWWKAEESEPLRYVTERPPWSDANLPALAPRLIGSPILAVVRSATAGIPAGVGSAHPFIHEGIAGSHNGFVTGFHDNTAWTFLEALPEDLRARVDVLSDSLLLFLMVVAARREASSEPLARAVALAAERATAVCTATGVNASLNLVAVDKTEIAAVRSASGVPSNSLYTLADGKRWGGGLLLASEPLDDAAGWTEVPDAHVCSITAGGVRCEPLG